MSHAGLECGKSLAAHCIYQEFVRQHPDSRSNYLWLMDLLLEDGRTAEARDALEAMGRLERTYHYDLYDGLIAKEEGNLPRALDCWKSMTDKEPESWMAWFCRADSLAKLAVMTKRPHAMRRRWRCSQSPGFCDMPEAMAQISEIQGNYARAIAMRERCVTICQEEWNSPKGKLWTCTAGKFSACGSVWSGNNKKQGAPERSSAPF